jgi:hypothetical protein
MENLDQEYQVTPKGEELANRIGSTRGVQGLLSSPIMSSVFKQNPARKQTQQKPTQSPKKTYQGESKKRTKKDPDFNTVATGIVRPLKFFDSVADILGKMYNFMRRKYIRDSRDYKKEKKYRRKLVAIKERRIEELIKLFNGKYKKPIFKDTEKDKSLVSKIVKFLVGGGLLIAASKAFASIPGLETILPSIPFLDDLLPDSIKKLLPPSASVGPGEVSKENYVKVKEIYSYLTKDKGLSKEQALGMLANIQAESSFNAGALGDKKDGVYTSGGLFQHHNERFANMVAAAGPNWQENWKGQIDFALSEKPGKAYAATKFDTAEQATEYWTKYFEKPANADQQAEVRKGNISKLNQIVQEVPAVAKNESTPTPKPEVQPPIPVSNSKPEIPNKINNKSTQKSSTVAVSNNQLNIINGSTNMAIAEEKNNGFAPLIQKQYYNYG